MSNLMGPVEQNLGDDAERPKQMAETFKFFASSQRQVIQ